MRITSAEIPNTIPCTLRRLFRQIYFKYSLGFLFVFELRSFLEFCSLERLSLPTWESSVARASGIVAAAVWISVDLLAFNPPVTLVYSGLETRGLCRNIYIA